MPLRARTENALLTLPLLVLLVVMLGFPTLLDIVYSLSHVSFEAIRSPKLAGFSNFTATLADPGFWKAVWFSLRFAVITAAIECVLGLVLAIYLSPLLRRFPALLAILIMPMVIAPAMMGLMYRLVLHEFIGPLPNFLLDHFNLSIGFLTPDTIFQTIVAIETLQWTPFTILLFHMAYEAIPDDIREVARVDGIGPLRLLARVELPMMLPTVALAAFIRFIDGFRVFDNVWTLSGTGPGGSTTSLAIYVYVTFFRTGNIGQAVAASILVFLATFAMLWLATRRRTEG